MSLFNKRGDPIGNTQKKELHHQVEKLDTDPKEAACVIKCSGVLAQENPEDFNTELSMKEFDKMYQSGVSAIVNATGRLPQKKEVYEEFLMKACGMGPEKHQALKRRALQEIAELSLHVGVLRAKDLLAKDNTCTSDPYCRVALVHKGEVKKPEKDLSHWKEKKVINTVLETPVIPKNLNPEWNKSFKLILMDPHTEYLAVEVWDSNADGQSFIETKGLQGIANYVHQLSSLNKDDFLGKLYVQLQELPAEETTKWYSLVSRKGKPEQGMIELDLQVHSKLQSMDEEAAMTMFTQMYRLLVSHERRQKGEFALCWDGALCRTAKEILSLLATRLDLDRLQQAVCKIHVLFRNKVLYPTAVLVEVKEICACRAQLDAEETRNKPWVENLMSSFKAMVKIVQDYIRDHQFKVDLKTAENVQMVGEMLQLMQVIYNIDSFVIMLDKDFANMKAVIQIALQGSSVRCYQQLMSSDSSPVEAAEAKGTKNRTSIAIGALREIVIFLASTDALQQQFSRVGVDYFETVYLTVDKQLAGDLESVINSENGGKCDPTDSFMLFDTVRAFMAMGKQLPEDMQEQLKLTGCYNLFRPQVPLWINERMVFFEQGMCKAIKAAEATPVVEAVKYSTAARDTVDLMVRVCAFWKTLQWPDPEESVAFLQYMTKNVCEKSLLFVDLMAQKLRSKGYYLKEREKEGVKMLVPSEKTCVHLSDIQQFRGALSDLPKHDYLDWAGQKATLPQDVVDSRVFQAMHAILENCDDDMQEKMVKLYDNICHCLKPSLRSAVMYTLDKRKILKKVLPFLMDYLTEMLARLYNRLFNSVFLSFLLSLWTQLVNIFSDIANDDKDKEMSERISKILKALLSCFNNEGAGLARADMMTKTYQELHNVLDLRLMPTDKVIEAYYKDLLEYQKTTPASRGSVSVVASYVEAHNQLDFTLVKGNNLPAEDLASKSSDPFAVISLVPEHLFEGVTSKKTEIHKRTLCPQFNADFHFHVEDRSVNGAALLIEVYDHDLFPRDDVIGMALVPLQSIPAVSSSDDSSLTSSSQHLVETIPLFIPVDSPALAELTNRAMGKTDLTAHEFVAKIKKLRSM